MASLITLGLGGTAGEFLLLGFGSAAVSNPNAFECGTFDSDYFDTNCPPTTGGGGKRRRRGKTIRFSDLDERERIEALASIPVRPYTPLEQAAVNLGEADESEMEEDEAILKALATLFTIH